MWTILAQVQTSRRKTHTFVLDEDAQLRWSGKTVGGALRYLHEEGHDKVALQGDGRDERFDLFFQPALAAEGDQQ